MNGLQSILRDTSYENKMNAHNPLCEKKLSQFWPRPIKMQRRFKSSLCKYNINLYINFDEYYQTYR